MGWLRIGVGIGAVVSVVNDVSVSPPLYKSYPGAAYTLGPAYPCDAMDSSATAHLACAARDQSWSAQCLCTEAIGS